MIKVNVDTREVRKLLSDFNRSVPDLVSKINRKSSEMTRRNATPVIPKFTGLLRRSGKTVSIGKGDYMLIYKRPPRAFPITSQSQDVAANAEKGTRSNGSRIDHWTTPGTGPNWMSDTRDRLYSTGVYRRIIENTLKTLFKQIK
jgi:hypothetical protein